MPGVVSSNIILHAGNIFPYKIDNVFWWLNTSSISKWNFSFWFCTRVLDLWNHNLILTVIDGLVHNRDSNCSILFSIENNFSSLWFWSGSFYLRVLFLHYFSLMFPHIIIIIIDDHWCTFMPFFQDKLNGCLFWDYRYGRWLSSSSTRYGSVLG